MTYLQIYIGVEREVRKFNSDIKLSSSDISYWLNKAVNEFIDAKYHRFDISEEIKRDLDYLIRPFELTTPVVTSFNSNTNLYTFTFPDYTTRFILTEQATINVNGVLSVMPIKPITLDQLNVEVLSPFSPYKLHMGEAKPLRYDSDYKSVLVADSAYTIPTYKGLRLINPTPFTVESASDTSDYIELPAKVHPELITITVRQILENESSPRYQTYNIEEVKSKS